MRWVQDRDYRRGTKPETGILGTEPPPSLYAKRVTVAAAIAYDVVRSKHPRAVSGTLPALRRLLLHRVCHHVTPSPYRL